MIAVDISADKNCLVLMGCLKENYREMNCAFELKYFAIQSKGELSVAVKELAQAFEINEYTVLKEEWKS